MDKPKPLRVIARGALRAFTIGHLKVAQGGLCAVCGLPISLQTMGKGSNYVADHNHQTGEIRGVLHRSCNAGIGKMEGALGQWVCKDTSYEAMIPMLERCLAYYKAPGTGIQYPGHKSASEVAEATRLKRNKAAALARASAKLKDKALEK